MYYRGANAALLLYDITNSSTFEDVRGWLEGEHGPEPFLAWTSNFPGRDPRHLTLTDAILHFRTQKELLTRSNHLYRWVEGRPASKPTSYF